MEQKYIDRLRLKVKRIVSYVLRNDITNRGERVDIDYRKSINFDRLDTYQKSHFKRYEYVLNMINPGMLIGDFACGTGYGTAMMAQVGKKIYGCDIDNKTITIVKKRYGFYKNIVLLCNDLLDLDLPMKLDLIASFETLEHFTEKNIPNLLIKFNSMLRPGGILVFSVPYMQSETSCSQKHHRTFQIDEIRVKDWINRSEFCLQGFKYQDYKSHLISEQITSKDFMIAICTKKEGARKTLANSQ